MNYRTLKEAGGLWNSFMRINASCFNGRIPGAVKPATVCMILKDTDKTVDK